jgi:hypothetical protein
LEKEREPRRERHGRLSHATHAIISHVAFGMEFLTLPKKPKVPPYGLSPSAIFCPALTLGSHNRRPDGLAASPRRKH